MVAKAVWTVHVSAPPIGLIQVCSVCGFVLEDVTPWYEGRVAVPEGQDTSHSWWPTGARIGTDTAAGSRGGCTFVLEDGQPLGADERLCAGVN